MSQGYPERYRDTSARGEGLRLGDSGARLQPRHQHNDDDIAALREENAQLRELVVRLSHLVVRNALDRK